MKISANLLLISFVALMILNVSKVSANSCFLSNEEGSSEYCDSGTPTSGLPVHGSSTISKKGTSSLCNNVNVFADKKQAEEYAKTHEYDNVVQVSGSGCWKPVCNNFNDCSTSSKTCCKSLINDTCWHECDICKFNRISNNYYPYADKKLENCELIGKNMMSSVSAVYTDNHSQQNYKINAIRNIEQTGTWNAEVWKCDEATLSGIMNTCRTAFSSTKYIKGYKTTSAPIKAEFCMNGEHQSIPFLPESNNYVQKVKDIYGGCPKSALKCNADSNDPYKKYYSTSSVCESSIGGGHTCAVVKNYIGYGDSECWHAVHECFEFSHGDYIVGNYNAMVNSSNPLKNTCHDGEGDPLAPLYNTKREYYCKNGVTPCQSSNAVQLNSRQCGACECKSGYDRVSECNNLVYGVLTGYYKAGYKGANVSKNSCISMGYSENKPIKNSCTACPYSAIYWKCD